MLKASKIFAIIGTIYPILFIIFLVVAVAINSSISSHLPAVPHDPRGNDGFISAEGLSRLLIIIAAIYHSIYTSIVSVATLISLHKESKKGIIVCAILNIPAFFITSILLFVSVERNLK